MREIKFRGKRIDNGEWIYGDLIHSYEITNGVRRDFILIGDYGESKLFEIIPKTVGQFTGLRDKNGKEIYGGDIIRAHGYANAKYLIRWNDNFASWFPEILNSEYKITYGTVWKDQICYDEVISDIHENPELMKS